MKSYFVLFIGISLSFSACQKEDTCELMPLTDSHELDGEWHLKGVICECPVVQLEEGENKWNINVDNNTLTVQDISTIDSEYIPHSGTYPLAITADSLYFGEWAYAIEQMGDNLRLYNMPESDGPTHLLER